MSLLLIGFNGISNAQDIQFSQFYSVTPYINPAFVGAKHATRAIVHLRDQWPGIAAKYETGLVSVDHFFDKYNSGIGVMVTQDQQGLNDIHSTKVDLQYSYELTVSKKFTMRGGLQVGYGNQAINYSNLTLASQIDPVTGQSNGSTGITGAVNQKGYVDVGAGFLGYTDRLWVSAAFAHINEPRLVYYSTDNAVSLPLKTTVSTGYKIPLKSSGHMAYLHEEDNIFLTPAANFKAQQSNSQLDIGCYLTYNQLMVGAWYRGMEFKRYAPNIYNSESAVASIGWLFNNWSVTYSYDITVSTLTRAGTGGSHELNITYVHNKVNKKSKVRKRLPCPDFYHTNKHH
ncbi:MAG TPA: type IX secretion system membrane protein PorP/SprF [Cytophagaceae bacterium]|nr:type IX secretion system membrane protein PorP/SprF [Cytophagaceae bacterium]